MDQQEKWSISLFVNAVATLPKRFHPMFHEMLRSKKRRVNYTESDKTGPSRKRHRINFKEKSESVNDSNQLWHAQQYPSIFHSLQARSIGGKSSNKNLCAKRITASLFTSKIQSVQTWRQCIPGNLHPVEKYFAVQWVSDRQVVVGSRCSQMLMFDVQSQVDATPVRLFRRTPSSVHETHSQTATGIGGGIHGIAMNPSFVSDRARCDRLSSSSFHHSSRVASAGAALGVEVGVYGVRKVHCKTAPVETHFGTPSRSQPPGELYQSHILAKHKDWVFGVDWVNDETLVSASRDKSLIVWKIPQCSNQDDSTVQEPMVITEPLACGTHDSSVRDVKYHRKLDRIASLSFDGTVALWDVSDNELRRSDTIHLQHIQECVTIAADDENDWLVVGSYTGLTFYDTRIKHNKPAMHVSTTEIDNIREVRSLSTQCGGCYVSVGGGSGGIGFVDVRQGQFINLNEVKKPGANARNTHSISDRSVEPGIWRRTLASGEDVHTRRLNLDTRDPLYARRITVKSPTIVKAFYDVPNSRASLQPRSSIGPVAVYSHQWDSSTNRLCAVGGPLNVGSLGAFVTLHG